MLARSTVDDASASTSIGHARLWARTRRPVLRGSPTRLAFTVTVERADVPPPPGPPPPVSTPQRPVMQAALNQQPILSRGVMLIGALLMIGLVAGAVYTLNGPKSNESAYQDVSKPRSPTLVAVQPTGPTTATVTWEPVSDVGGYKVKLIDPASGARSASSRSTPNRTRPSRRASPRAARCASGSSRS